MRRGRRRRGGRSVEDANLRAGGLGGSRLDRRRLGVEARIQSSGFPRGSAGAAFGPVSGGGAGAAGGAPTAASGPAACAASGVGAGAAPGAAAAAAASFARSRRTSSKASLAFGDACCGKLGGGVGLERVPKLDFGLVGVDGVEGDQPQVEARLGGERPGGRSREHAAQDDGRLRVLEVLEEPDASLETRLALASKRTAAPRWRARAPVSTRAPSGVHRTRPLRSKTTGLGYVACTSGRPRVDGFGAESRQPFPARLPRPAGGRHAGLVHAPGGPLPARVPRASGRSATS